LGSAFATFDLGTGSATLSNFNGGALTYDLGGLAGGANTVVAGRMTNNVFTNATCTYSIGANGSNTVFAGSIKDGFDVASTVSVVKVGTGSLLLNGASTYTGGTTVSNGILGGTGSIAGALTLTANGTLSPGASIGTFTVGGAAALAGTVLLELNRTAPATNDQLSVAGTITATGTLIVTNVGPGLFSGKYQLFNKGVTGFSVTLPAKDPTATTNYNWSNDIALNGSITLLNGLPVGPSTAPFVMTNSYSSVDGKLTLSWPLDHTGFRLVSNSVSLTETSMWFQVFNNAENTNKVILTIDPAKTNVFFRLTYP
jgi:autotransporter-associated beta strand protein